MKLINKKNQGVVALEYVVVAGLAVILAVSVLASGGTLEAAITALLNSISTALTNLGGVITALTF